MHNLFLNLLHSNFYCRKGDSSSVGSGLKACTSLKHPLIISVLDSATS